ncbi:MAG: hypothetical protein V8K32_07355 [Candidatus Electrothrix gigas]
MSRKEFSGGLRLALLGQINRKPVHLLGILLKKQKQGVKLIA